MGNNHQYFPFGTSGIKLPRVHVKVIVCLETHNHPRLGAVLPQAVLAIIFIAITYRLNPMAAANTMSALNAAAPSAIRPATPRQSAAPRPSQRNVAMRAGYDQVSQICA